MVEFDTYVTAMITLHPIKETERYRKHNKNYSPNYLIPNFYDLSNIVKFDKAEDGKCIVVYEWEGKDESFNEHIPCYEMYDDVMESMRKWEAKYKFILPNCSDYDGSVEEKL